MLRFGTVCLLLALFCRLGWAADQPSGSRSVNPQVVVSVYNNAGVSEGVIVDAEKEMSRVFRQLSVGLTWVNCGLQTEEPLACRQRFLSTQLSIRVVRRSLVLPDTAVGVAFLGADGSGRYADVFLDPVRRLHAEDARTNEARVLGYVMAHEIGHLLLGRNAHASAGIMEPRWSAAELRNLAMGRLEFTRAEGETIRRRVEALSRRAPSAITLNRSF